MNRLVVISSFNQMYLNKLSFLTFQTLSLGRHSTRARLKSWLKEHCSLELEFILAPEDEKHFHKSTYVLLKFSAGMLSSWLGCKPQLCYLCNCRLVLFILGLPYLTSFMDCVSSHTQAWYQVRDRESKSIFTSIVSLSLAVQQDKCSCIHELHNPLQNHGCIQEMEKWELLAY